MKRILSTVIGIITVLGLAFGAASPASASSWAGEGEHHQAVTCDAQSHTITVDISATPMNGYINGQSVGYRTWIRDLSSSNWAATSWRTVTVSPVNRSYGDGLPDYYYYTTQVGRTAMQGTPGHRYSVYVEYWYANQANVWTWHDVLATTSYLVPGSTGYGYFQAANASTSTCAV